MRRPPRGTRDDDGTFPRSRRPMIAVEEVARTGVSARRGTAPGLAMTVRGITETCIIGVGRFRRCLPCPCAVGCGEDP